MNGLFDNLKFKIDKPIRLIELFGGIGSQAMALRNVGADFEHWRLVEFDKYAVASYNAIHGTDFKTTDIKAVRAEDLGITETDKFTYIMCYSFPCQDLSLAGLGRGMKKGGNTRSGLLWEVQRILEECGELPQVLLMENVAQVHGKKNLADFNSWMDFLKSKGYENFWRDLNAKDYGIPQNRVRCFMVSILADEFVDYEFPEKTELKKVMKDLLEDSVDEKYYINNEKAKKLIEQLIVDNELKNCTDKITCASQDKLDGKGKFLTMDDLKLKDINKKLSSTICARVYKGFGANGDNALIVKEQ